MTLVPGTPIGPEISSDHLGAWVDVIYIKDGTMQPTLTGEIDPRTDSATLVISNDRNVTSIPIRWVLDVGAASRPSTSAPL